MPFSMRTIAQINCGSFDSIFKSQYKIKVIKNIDEFAHLLKNIKPNKTKFEVDVRAQAIVYKDDGSKDILCLGKWDFAELNGRPVMISKKFSNYVKGVVGE